MATITIRDLDESLKQRLRVRAAHADRSMEEEVRQILRAALTAVPEPESGLVERVRARFAGMGDIELPLAEREPVRPPLPFNDPRTRRSRAKRPAPRTPK